jgi:hypothetical protein
MLIPLGIFASSGARATGAFDLLESTVLTSSQATVSFTNLVSKYAATYQHLQLRAVVNTPSASNQYLRFNTDSTSSYVWHFLNANGSTVTSGLGPVFTGINWVIPNGDANNFAAAVVDILDPFETTKNKTIRAFFGSARSGTNWLTLNSGAWLKTDAISSISLGHGQDWTQFSRFSLYGIKATA